MRDFLLEKDGRGTGLPRASVSVDRDIGRIHPLALPLLTPASLWCWRPPVRFSSTFTGLHLKHSRVSLLPYYLEEKDEAWLHVYDKAARMEL